MGGGLFGAVPARIEESFQAADGRAGLGGIWSIVLRAPLMAFLAVFVIPAVRPGWTIHALVARGAQVG